MNTCLDTLFDLALARTLIARDVDHPLSQHGISLSDLAILRELRAAPDEKLRRSELAQRLGVTPSGVARQLGPLERIGLVDRESHDRDARLALVVLTAAGIRVVDEALQTQRTQPSARSQPAGASPSGSASRSCSQRFVSGS